MADTDSGSGLDDFFAKKYGPLPGWAWTAVAAGGAGLYIWYKDKHPSTSTSSSSTTSATTSNFDYGPSIAAQQSEIQNLQGAVSGLGTTSASSNTTASSTTGTSTTSTATQGPTQFSVAAGSQTSGATPTTKIYGGQSLGQVLGELQSEGYGVSSVSYAGNNLSTSQISQYYGTPVYSVTTTGNNVAVGLQ